MFLTLSAATIVAYACSQTFGGNDEGGAGLIGVESAMVHIAVGKVTGVDTWV